MKGYPLGFLVNHLDSIPDVLICNETGITTQKSIHSLIRIAKNLIFVWLYLSHYISEHLSCYLNGSQESPEGNLSFETKIMLLHVWVHFCLQYAFWVAKGIFWSIQKDPDQNEWTYHYIKGAGDFIFYALLICFYTKHHKS